MKFLEELKAAQKEIGEADPKSILNSIEMTNDEIDSFAAVLRRIPQLIEAVDYLQQQKDSSEEAKENFSDFRQDTIIIDLVSTFFSKLEEGASKDAGKKDE